mgnify:CR=1 FL=1
MPKQSTKVEFNTFVKGLITEASPLNFPKDASLDEENFELKRNGGRRRRLGFAFEEGYSEIPLTNFSLENYAVASPTNFKWTEVGGKATQNFVVVQANSTLYFFDMNQEDLSTTGYLGSLSLEDFPTAVQYSLTSIDGFLVVAAGVGVIAIVSYDGTTFSASYERLMVRDLWGIEA